MNPVVEEMLAILNDNTDDIMHIGMPRRSGRYPWGSGEDPYQHSKDFLGRVEELRKQNFTYTDKHGNKYKGDTAIAKSLGLSTTQFRTEIALAKDERRMLDVAKAKSLRDDGLSTTEIGRQMGVNESTVRSWFNAESEARMKQAQETAKFLKEQVDKKEMVDVGRGVERELNISKEKLDQALYILQREGYNVYPGRFPQPTNPGQFTTQKILAKPEIQYKEIYELDRVKTLNDYISRDGGDTYEKKFNYPSSLDSKRLKIRYSEDGGIDKDGVIELRRNVADLSLGENRYSQVRILVDGTHYLKGMAVYSDNMPDGVDVVFNTNKKKGTPMTSVLKKIKEDPDNPFGSAIKDADQGGQYWYNDPKTGEKKLGLINKARAEGDWNEWKDALPSQFLAKQSLSMAKKQLNLAKADKLDEYDEICSLTNPTIKKHYLQKFADGCDAAAAHLKAAALPGQKYHVILPDNTLKETEVFAPNYENGTKLALIRYPHGGTFEIPILTVNNKNASAKKLIGTDSIDAVCINSKVAGKLSGADFDGDTVMCIPTHDSKGKVKIASRNSLPGLEGFDPKDSYGPDTYKGQNVRLMTKRGTQTQMGIISNLITDMTIAGANDDELARAVRHSMVVIDAFKHELNYKQSELDNNIAALHKKYQGKSTGGAATILSRAKGEQSVEKRQGTPRINNKKNAYKNDPDNNDIWYDPSKPEGSLLYKTADDLTYTVKKVNKRTGEVTEVTKKRMQASTKMAETDDAYSLVSPDRHPMEIVYADYANSMKSLANRARMELMSTGRVTYSKSAHDAYIDEVKSLDTKLHEAELNTTRERAATRMAAAEVKAKTAANPNMDKSDIKKTSQRAVTKYRQEVGSISRKDRAIKITDKEWEAIQAGAISESKLSRILANSDVDSLRQRAMPKTSGNKLSTAKVNRIKQLSNSNYTLSEIANKLNISTETVSKYLKGVN